MAPPLTTNKQCCLQTIQVERARLYALSRVDTFMFRLQQLLMCGSEALVFPQTPSSFFPLQGESLICPL